MRWQDASARRNAFGAILLVICSSGLAYFVMEVAYRGYQYFALPQEIFAVIDANKPLGGWADQYRFDADAGILYTPNFSGERGHPWFSRWRTNSHGHVSGDEYPVAKPSDEFRIAVVGDSFTAAITSNVRWTDLLEQLLNGNEQWRSSQGGKHTRVINFAVDGTGIHHFAGIVRHHVPRFDSRKRMAQVLLPQCSSCGDRQRRQCPLLCTAEHLGWDFLVFRLP
jgi:hypothetical protein